MKCNQCQFDDTKVIESRDVTDGRRFVGGECAACGYRFTTYERLERPQLIVVKNDGTRELFNRTKLLGGLYRACEKTSVSKLQLESLVSDIEQELYAACAEGEVPTATVGDLVMKRLSQLNEVAYVRFASVYRRFTDIKGFERELTQIKQRKSTELVKRLASVAPS